MILSIKWIFKKKATEQMKKTEKNDWVEKNLWQTF